MLQICSTVMETIHQTHQWSLFMHLSDDTKVKHEMANMQDPVFATCCIPDLLSSLLDQPFQAKHEPELGCLVAWQTKAPFPVLATICGMQQNGRPAYNPPLIAIEADRVETIVEALVLCCSNSSGIPGLSPICSLQQRLTCAQQETCMLL